MTNVQTSLASQFQYRPHACSAQIDPAIRVNVHRTNPMALRRYDQFSNADDEGTRRRNPETVLFFSVRCLINCSTDMAKVNEKIPVAMTATDTWVTIHQDCRAGWTLPAGVGKPTVAAIIINNTTPETNVPTNRRSLRTKNTR